MNRVVAVAPHPDDEVIGSGGSLLKHKIDGDKVFIVYMTTGEVLIHDEKNYQERVHVRKCEAHNVCNKGNFELLYWSNIPARAIAEQSYTIKKDLIKIFQYVKPNYLYIPNKEEKDLDHVICHNIAKEAYWLSQISIESKVNSVNALVYNYEVWSPLNEIHKCINITDYIEQKVELINAYKSQVMVFDYAEGIKSLNKYRSIFSGGTGFAEAFMVEAF